MRGRDSRTAVESQDVEINPSKEEEKKIESIALPAHNIMGFMHSLVMVSAMGDIFMVCRVETHGMHTLHRGEVSDHTETSFGPVERTLQFLNTFHFSY